MNHLPAPTDPPAITAVWVINRTADAYDTYVKSLPEGPVRFVFEVAPRKNCGHRFPPECPKDTIALLEFDNGGGACITKRDLPVAYEAPGRRRRIFSVPANGKAG